MDNFAPPKSTKKRQTEKLLKHFELNQVITKREAEDELNIFGLPARIMELKQDGHQIETIKGENGLAKYYYAGYREPTNKPIPSFLRKLEIKTRLKHLNREIRSLKSELSQFA